MLLDKNHSSAADGRWLWAPPAGRTCVEGYVDEGGDTLVGPGEAAAEADLG